MVKEGKTLDEITALPDAPAPGAAPRGAAPAAPAAAAARGSAPRPLTYVETAYQEMTKGAVAKK